MILSGEDIHKALTEGRMIIEPVPGEDQIDTTSVDLHLGEPLWIWNPELTGGGNANLKINIEEYDYREFSKQYQVEVPKEPGGRYLIQPNRVYLGSTHEKVRFPAGSKLAGRVEGKSSLARLGLAVHMTAPMIHCGTGLGVITLEMFNHGSFDIEVTPGKTRICQLILEEVSREPAERTGKTFTRQKNAQG
ncbi:MAG: dCTP deaminase [Nitrospinaceae bacterium]|nr:dCTP deaminase [Nitrospinaceae bacterium]NIR53316.1 dCTP deaminase [Nitrospinaceae bacterium]NIS83714.1 dCTP deaminase [Nitrospinaceae bacterium]NIT80510.1 dCTP deaminase [Nitrospinaceae bacterium]NIU42838.1 dCTP deaminase [Nitrospinaceae bacterium]